MYSDYDVKAVFLMLGPACNFHCKHCVQALGTPRIKKQITPDTLNYLAELGGKRNEENKIKLIFFGGEPFLYRPQMIEIVAALGDIFNYSIISNGSLVTDEDVVWLNENKIHLTLSNDGPLTDKVRDKNVLEDPILLERYLKIESKSIEAVHHSYSQDLFKVIHYFEEKLPGTPYYFDNLYCLDNVPSDYVSLDLNICKESSEKLVTEFLENFKTKTFAPATNLILPMIDDIEENLKALENNELPSKLSCGASKSHLNIDLQGNIYLCHNTSIIMGTIYDEYSTVRKKIIDCFSKRHQQQLKDKSCASCDIAPLCKGSCPLETNSKLYLNACNFKKIRWKLAFDVLEEIDILIAKEKEKLLNEDTSL